MVRKFLNILVCSVVGLGVYLGGGLTLTEAATVTDNSYTIGEVKFFSLAERDVVAIGVDARMPTDSVADPLDYKLVLNYSELRKKGELEVVVADVNQALPSENSGLNIETKLINDNYLTEITIDKSSLPNLKIKSIFPGNIKPQVTTVKRKRVVNKDGTSTFRTYLVIDFTSNTLKAKTIVVDPGHGGRDTGAVNNFLCEKDLNLMIGLQTRDLFSKKGYDVYITRNDDTFIPLLDRADAANILNAAAFISVHNNSVPTDMLEPAKKLYRGSTVLYNSAAVHPAKDLATIMCDELVNTLRTHQYPLQDRPGLVVLNATWVPAVLAEISMMPHPQDAKMISQPVYQHKAAEAIVTATEKYFKNVPLDVTDSSVVSQNTVNHGLAVTKDDYLYYIEQIGDIYAGCSEQIIKVNKNGGERQVLTTDEAWDLNIVGDFLYYSNWSDGHRIYKIKTDGTEKSAITSDAASQIKVVNDGLAYIKWSIAGAKDNYLYKSSFDGQEKRVLSSSPADNLSIVGEWAYYSNRADNYRPYKVRLDGTAETKISDQSMFFMVVEKDWIYYSNYLESGKLYKMHVDGTGNIKVADDKVGFINIMGEWIYYTNSSDADNLYKVKADGSGRCKVYSSSGVPLPINMVDGKVYYNGQFL